MGYYTKFEFKLTLDKEVPDEVVQFLGNRVLGEMFGETLPVPEHPFFYLPRWDQVFMRFEGMPDTSFEKENGYWKLYLTGDINYGHEEIVEFAKWISPYIAGRKKRRYIGWLKGEEMRESINIYVEKL